MKTPLFSIVSVSMAATAFGAAAPATQPVRTLLSSAVAGPTVLLVTESATRDLSPDVALQQISTWTLDRGKVVAAAMADEKSAIAAMTPDVVIELRASRASKQSAAVEARGVDGTKLLMSLNKLVDPLENEESLKLTAGDADLPAGPATAVQLMLVQKKGGTTPASRSRLFRHAVNTVLVEQQMTHSDPWLLVDRKPGDTLVAIYAGYGSDGSPGPVAYPKALELEPDVHYTYIGREELVRPETLKQFDALVFCGGSGSAQGKAIGKQGAEVVRDFVKNGGGYVSSCAGSYLASSHYPWSLHIINSDVVDAAHWARGMGDVDVEMTPAGREILGDYTGLFKIHYANGPLLGPASEKDLPAYTPLAYFRGDMHKTAPGGVMPGTPAIIAADYGKGRVICFSPHPEYTDGLGGFIDRAVKWTLHKPEPTTRPVMDKTASAK